MTDTVPFDLLNVLQLTMDVPQERKMFILLEQLVKLGNDYNALLNKSSGDSLPNTVKIQEDALENAHNEIARLKEESQKATQEIADLKLKLATAEKNSDQLNRLKKSLSALCVDENIQPTHEPEIDSNGVKRWYKIIGGIKLLHRDNDLPAIEHSDGALSWYQNGQLHRYGDKPAYIGDTLISYWKNGKRFREGGKAAVYHISGLREYVNETGRVVSRIQGPPGFGDMNL